MAIETIDKGTNQMILEKKLFFANGSSHWYLLPFIQSITNCRSVLFTITCANMAVVLTAVKNNRRAVGYAREAEMFISMSLSVSQLSRIAGPDCVVGNGR